MPIYNAEPWLREALDSLKTQSHTDFEAILVCDGPTDRSEEICREYAAADRRLRILTQYNQGLSAARNHGIDHARGEWIFFLDADDMMMPDTLAALLAAANATGTRIAGGDFARGEHLKPNPSESSKEIHPVVLSAEDAIITGLYQKRIINHAWGMLYHASIFSGPDSLRFRNCYYEDLDFFYRAFERADQICLIDKCVYFYRDNPESFINTWSASRLDVLDVTDRIAECMSGRSPKLRSAARDRRFSAHFNMLLLMLRHGIDLPEQKERCLRVIRAGRRDELRDPDVRIKNKFGALLSYLGMPAMKTLCRLSH